MADALRYEDIEFVEEYVSRGHRQNPTQPARVHAHVPELGLSVTAEGPERSFKLRSTCYSLLSQQLQEKSR